MPRRKRTVRHDEKALERMVRKKIGTIEDARKYMEGKAAAPRKNRGHAAKAQYPQHDLTDEQLEHLLVDLDKDIE